MGITLDEAITYTEKVAEENQRVVDTGIVFNDVTIDMLYCDDTEVIEEHLANYQKCAEEHRQLADWLKDYKRLKEQGLCEDVISRQAAIRIAEQGQVQGYEWQFKELTELPPVKSQDSKTGHWILLPSNKEQGERDFIWWKCSECGQVIYSATEKDRREYHAFCGRCGARMLEL